MIARASLSAVVFLTTGFLAFVMVVMSSVSLKLAAVLLPAIAIGIGFGLVPFAGLILLVAFAQLDAFANMVSQFLPLSFYKLLSAATLGGFIVMSFSTRRDQRIGPRSNEMKFAFMFATAMALSFVVAEHKAAALDHSIGFISVMLLFFLIVAVVDTLKKLKVLVWTLVVAGLISASITLIESLFNIRLVATSTAAATAAFEGQSRSSGASDFNPTTAAHMLMTMTVLSGVLFVYHPKWRWLTGLALIVGVPALVFTFARSAVIAFALIVAVFAFKNRSHRLFPFCFMLGLVCTAVALPFIPELFWERMGTLLDFQVDRTLLRRVSYNLIGLHLWAEHPVLGVGPGNFPIYYSGPEFRWLPGRVPVPRQLHNSYLEVATEMGLLGIVTFLAVMLSSLRRGIATAQKAHGQLRIHAMALSYAFAAFLIASIFMPNEDTKFMWILPGLCVAAWRVFTIEQSSAPES